MKLLLSIIATLFAAFWIVQPLRKNPGFAIFGFGQITVETSFAFMLFFLLVAFVVFYILVRLLVRFWRSPALTAEANRRWHQQNARHLFNKGLRQIAAGHTVEAEKTLLKSALYSEHPEQHYLSAARAVHHQHSEEKWRRDLHIREAEQCPGVDLLPIRLTQAEFLLDDGEAEQARTILEKLHQQHPQHSGVLQGLAKTYQRLAAWEPLRDLLPELDKKKALGAETLNALQKETFRGLLTSVSAGGSLEQLHDSWKQIPATLRETSEELVIAYATALCEYEAFDQAEQVLRETINRHWNPKLVVGYGLLERGNAATQLTAAETWLAAHGDDPYLLLTLGRLARRCQKHDQARAYLEASIRRMPTPDAYQELGELLQEQNEPAYAGQCFHAGLRLLTGQREQKQGIALPAAEAAQQLSGPVAAG